MANMNLIVDLKGYDGTNANTCSPNFGKSLQYIGIDTSEEIIIEVTVPTMTIMPLFSVSTPNAKKFIYLEASAECDLTLNGGAEVTTIKPVIIGTTVNKGIYLLSASIESISITNNSATDLTVSFITVK